MKEYSAEYYKGVNEERKTRFLLLHNNKKMIASSKAYYEEKPMEFIKHWGVTYDPRNAGSGKPTMMPFCLFPRQEVFIDFMYQCFLDQENGAIEKCRDFGATWCACNFALWLWFFHEGSSIGFGSRKEQLVDRIADPDSIFEKMRMILKNLPSFYKPDGFNQEKHTPYMRIINPENGATIVGESGDSIGRGGRTSIYFKDEAQPLYSKLLTRDGWITMADAKVGISVIGSDGKETKIIQVKDFKDRNIYEIGFTDGTTVECSENHLWTVEDVMSGFKEKTINTKLISEGYFTTLFRYKVPKFNPHTSMNVGDNRLNFSKVVGSVKKIKTGDVRCITVENEDGLYVTDNFTVTHNSAFYDRPERIEASLGDNTNVQIDISSVNGPTTVFQRKIESGEIWEKGKKMERGATRVFILDWKDHPFKDQAWYDARRAKAEREGLLHVFASEVDRDPSSAVEGTLIPSDWVKSSVDAHIKLNFEDDGMVISAFDVADEGKDKHALATRKGIVLKRCEEWYTGDTGEATRKALFHCRQDKSTSLQYDCIGVGAGAKAEINRLTKTNVIDKRLLITPWNASAAALFPNANVVPGDRQTPKNKDFYGNVKAQGWWNLRTRFEKTHNSVVNGVDYPEDELISISSKVTDIHKIVKELSQPTYTTNSKGKMIVDKTPDGSKSPNRADAIMMCFWPVVARRVVI